MSLLSKIFVGLIFLAALPFSWFAAKTLKTHTNWRTKYENIQKQIKDAEARQVALAEGEQPADEGASFVPGIRQINQELSRERDLRGRVWRVADVDLPADDNGQVTLTIKHPWPHGITADDAGKLVVYAFELSVWQLEGEGDIEVDEVEDDFDEELDGDIPIEDAVEEPMDGGAPADGAPADDAAAPAAGQARHGGASEEVCQDEPPAEGDDMMEDGGEEGGEEGGEGEEGEGEEGEEDLEEEEEVVEEPEEEDDSDKEYRIEKYMGQFRVTAVVGNQITLECIENLAPLQLKQMKESPGPWILFGSMPIDNPEAYKAWDEDTLREKLPASTVAELEKQGQDLGEGESAPWEWVEVKFTRAHQVNLSDLVEQVERELTRKAREEREQVLLAEGKDRVEIDEELEKIEIKLEGFGPILDPEKPEPAPGEEGEEGDGAARPGVPVVVRPPARQPVAKPTALRVRFRPGDTAVFDVKTAKQLTTEVTIENDDGTTTTIKPVADEVRRFRRWHLRDYARYFNFISGQIAYLFDRIEESENDRDRLVGVDGDGQAVGAIAQLRAKHTAREAHKNMLLADLDNMKYQFQTVGEYEKLVGRQLAQVNAQRDALRKKLAALANRLARLQLEQYRLIQERAAAADVAAGR